MQPQPVTAQQHAALISYVSAMLYFMTTGGTSARRLLDAKALMEQEFGLRLPDAVPLPDIL